MVCSNHKSKDQLASWINSTVPTEAAETTCKDVSATFVTTIFISRLHRKLMFVLQPDSSSIGCKA